MRLARVTIGMRLMASVGLAVLLLAGLAGGMVLQLDQAAAGAAPETRAAIAEASRTLLLVVGAITLVQLLGGWLAARAIVYPLREMVGAVNRIARGDTSRPVDFGTRQDEIGTMAQGLEALRQVANDAFAQGQMLGQLPNPVMAADPAENFRVTYMNQAGETLFAAMAQPAGLPPEVQSLLADRAALPRSTRIVLGAETLQLRISAILSRDGAYLGPMLRWTNVTGQVRLAEKFEQEVAAVVEAVGHAAGSMREVAEAMARTASETGMRAGGVSAASDQAAANVQTVAASAEQLAASVHEISRQVSESARIAGQAAAQAEATDHSVHSLSEAAQRIGDVVRLIGDIASQTNLLALNATIEAARAGEAGRGFAVVAGEVKSLAGQTARATEEIAAQIAAMQGATGHAVEAIRSIGTTIGRMNEIATSIASAVEEQGAATAEIARSVQQASIGTSEVSGTMGAVSNAVGEAGAQAGQVLDAARQLSGESDRLKGQVAGFLQALRAA